MPDAFTSIDPATFDTGAHDYLIENVAAGTYYFMVYLDTDTADNPYQFTAAVDPSAGNDYADVGDFLEVVVTEDNQTTQDFTLVDP